MQSKYCGLYMSTSILLDK